MTDNNEVNTENEFSLTDQQVGICRLLGIPDNGYKDNDSFISAIKEAVSKRDDVRFEDGKLITAGNAAFLINEEQDTNPNKKDKQQPTNENDEVVSDDKDSKNKDDEEKSLNVDGEEPIAPTAPSDENSDELPDWVKKKIADYQEMAEGKIDVYPKLEGYEPDKGLTDSFGASFNGGHIHYADKYNVTVSEESNLSVFEILVSEPDNKGRVVNFGPNLNHEQSVKLLAACLLHDNPLGENIPQLSPEDVRSIETELKDRPDDLHKFQEKVAPYAQSIQQNTNGHEEDMEKSFDDQTRKDIKEALEHQYKLSALEAKGVVEKDADKKVITDDDGKPQKSATASQRDYDEYIELREKKVKVGDNEISEKEFLAQKFMENPGEIRALVNAIVEDMHKEKVAAIREKMAQMNKTDDGKSNDLLEHDKRILALSGRLAEGDKAFVTKKEGKQEVQALTGERLAKFEALNKEAIARAMDNYKSNNK